MGDYGYWVEWRRYVMIILASRFEEVCVPKIAWVIVIALFLMAVIQNWRDKSK